MIKTEYLALCKRVRSCVSLSRGYPLSLVGDETISRDNREIFSRLLESWLFLTEDLMLRAGVSQEGRVARSMNFVHAICSVPFVDTLTAFEEVYSYLIDTDSTVEGFKRLLSVLPLSCEVVGRLLSPINRTLYQFLGEGRNPHLLIDLAQFLRFPRKVEFQSIGLEDYALDDYFETDARVGTVDLDSDDVNSLLTSLESILKDWLSGLTLDNVVPLHGPGSVAEGPLTLADKFHAMKVDAKLRVLLRSYGTVDCSGYFPGPIPDGLVRCSRTIFVPKTASKLRTISAEPATLQYLQQGVMRELYAYIDQHPVLGVHVRLDDQVQNQIWALTGSITHDYGTIDLSAASDSVSWRLVRRLFRSSPHLYRWLVGTRSIETLLPTGEILRYNKFAPMGSALCFPIECLLFAACAELASSRLSVRAPGKFPPFWSVYGDDIIVHKAAYEECVNILMALGFKVNKSKSYNSGLYRESCGREFYDGVDITPLYYRTPFYRGRPSPGAYSSWCSSANNALLHRLPLYRRHLILKCLSVSRLYGPYFVDTAEQSPYIWSSEPTNFHVKSRWNSDLQRLEGRFLTLKCKERSREECDEYLRYFNTLLLMARRSPNQREVSPPEFALRGCVEFFSSTPLPIQPFIKPLASCSAVRLSTDLP